MKYDIIVIGAGSGGLNVASFMNRAGFKILLIEKTDDNIGGDCLNWGCVPSKALIHCAKLVYSANEAKKLGLKVSGTADLAKVAEYVKSKVNFIKKNENAAYFRNRGIDVELGTAKFLDSNSIIVNGKIFKSKKIILATGSRPRELKLPGVEKINYLTNESIFDLTKLPKNLVIIGGGPIGVELGQAFSRLGSKVTIIQRGVQFLNKELPEIAQVLYTQLKNEGIKFYFNTTLEKFTTKDSLVIKDKTGKRTTIKFDQVLVSIGRVLNVEGLDLEKAGIELENGKIKVDKYLRTTNKNVLLSGDIAGQYQFTHAAELHANVIITNCFTPFKKKVNYDNFSWVTFTSPEIATFGLSRQQLDNRGIRYEKLVLDFSHDDRAIVDDAIGKSIIYVSNNKILGGSMVADNAGEIFQELVLANNCGLNIKKLFNKIYAYPTASRVNKAIIASHFKKKLTENAKKVLQLLF
jgi:pyruvate/2-oxoglutarate dehydrogenase complex dihydrolipoamide dehydrogenase (E3) component